MRLWVRADGSKSLGLGHITRTLSIADEAVDHRIPVTYLTAKADGIAQGMVRARGISICDLSSENDRTWIEQVSSGDAVIFDGYHFGDIDFCAAHDAGARTMAIDDLGGIFNVDVLVNPNETDGSSYEVSNKTKLLLGPDYALVGREFRKRRKERWGEHRTLLVAAGSSDHGGLTSRVLESIDARFLFERALVVIGPGADLGSTPTVGPIEVHRSPAAPWNSFDDASAAVSAAGVTAWELLCMGVPTAFVKVADNQGGIVRTIKSREAGIVLEGSATEKEGLADAIERLADADTQRTLSRAALLLVDGLGSQRVARTLFEGL
ncbi:MAG: UDP-2,4-diacetamido-2,4,6-trideoxy-beta-L-altropyranose hydrolase [Actinomycetota bacterium]|nr:UDP-2,4-diacetamido-2,4,6-trideoxy-beta-L-altropyranose hydrolase [Actinomycetota bacterium]